MRLFKSKKGMLIASLGLSLLGIIVASISTFAWFQQNYINNNISTAGDGTVGDSTLNIDSVKGYKYAFDDTTPTEVGTTGTVIGQSDGNNYDESTTETLDRPIEGLGYYIIVEEDGKFSYSNSNVYKMEDRYYDNNAFKRVNLNAGDVVTIRKHSGMNISDVDLTSFSIDASYTSNISYTNGNAGFTVNAGKGGSYDLYVNYSEQIAIGAYTYNASYNSNNVSTLSNINKKSAAVSTKIYFDCSAITWWADEGALPRCWFSNPGVQAVGTAFTNYISEVEVPAGADTGLIYFKRKNPSTEEYWNTEHTIYYTPLLNGQTIYITADTAGGHNWNISTGHYIVGSGGTFSSNTWSLLSAISMSSDLPDNKAKKSTTLQSGTTFRCVSVNASNPTKDSNFVWRGWSDPVSNDTSAFTTSGDNRQTNREITCTVYINNSGNTYISINTYSITLQYVTYNLAGTTPESSTTTTISSWTGFTGTDITSGTQVTLPTTNAPSVTDYDWAGVWYSTINETTGALSNTITTITPTSSDVIVYTKYTAKPTVTLHYKIYDSTGTTPISNSWVTWTTTRVTKDGTYSLSSSPSLEGYDWGETWWNNTDMADGHIISSGNKTITTDTDYYTTFKEKSFNITVQVAYTAANSLRQASWGGSTTIAVSSSTNITQDMLDTAKATIDASIQRIDTVNYNERSGYYLVYSNSTFSSNTTSSFTGASVSGSPTVYKVYSPKPNITVTYKYQCFKKDNTTNNETRVDTDESPLVSNQTINNLYYGASFNVIDHLPTTQEYIYGSSSLHGAYDFTWDNNLYCEDGTPYTSTTLYSDLVLIVKLTSTYDRIYVRNSIKDTDATDWYPHSNFTISLNMDTSIISSEGKTYHGDTTIDLGYQSSDEISYFEMHKTRFKFKIQTSATTEHGTRYTYYIDGLVSQTDSNGHTRGHCNAIELLNTYKASSPWDRFWAWSTYYGNGGGGSAVISAKIFFASGSTLSSVNLFNGDGSSFMFVNTTGFRMVSGDKFAIRIYNKSGSNLYSWLGYNDIDSGSSSFVTNGSTATVGDASNSTVTTTLLSIKDSGYYNIYITSQGKIKLQACSKTKGEGYYIMRYDSDGINGNKDTNSYENGIKMKPTGLSSSGYNVAYYKYFHVAAGGVYYIKSFIDNVDTLYTNYGSSLSGVSFDSGKISFTYEGDYNIYLKKDSGIITIYIAKSDSNFFKLNDFNSGISSDDIKDYNTTLILEVKFSTTTTVPSQIGINIARTTSNQGLSQYLKFNVMLSSTELGTSAYDTMRSDYYDGVTLSTNNVVRKFDETEGHVIPANSSASTYFYAYIMIDYTTKTISTSNTFNDFTIGLIARS